MTANTGDGVAGGGADSEYKVKVSRFDGSSWGGEVESKMMTQEQAFEMWREVLTVINKHNELSEA